MSDRNFLDMDGAPLEAADVAILLVPFEGTVCYGAGTGQGPEAILRAGPHLETFDEELGWDVDGNLKIATLPAIGPSESERPESFLARVEKTCAALGLMPPFPLTFGGEHSISPAVMAGLRHDWSDVTVVHIDAHADLRDEYLGSPLNHACAMRRILDLGVAKLISIGIRSCTSEEYELARDDARIQTLYAHHMRDSKRWKSLLHDLRDLQGDVYLTIDIDGLDCTLCPGTGTPQPGGLSWSQALEVLQATIRGSRANLIGADIVETAPMAGTQVNEMVAAKLGYKILTYRFAPNLRRSPS
jgi:agmatinase